MSDSVQQKLLDSEESYLNTTFWEIYPLFLLVRDGDSDRLKESLDIELEKFPIGRITRDLKTQLEYLTVSLVNTFMIAAIEGGVYPDTALTLTDRYFQAVEAATTYQEITAITSTMQADFVNRVHKIRQEASSSKTIRAVKDYIDLHKEEEIRLKDLSNKLGYTEYYLSKKFKKETGTSFKEYIRDVRLDYALLLLSHSNDSIREISERLHFPSQSYFSQVFKEKYGKTPNQYREDPV